MPKTNIINVSKKLKCGQRYKNTATNKKCIIFVLFKKICCVLRIALINNSNHFVSIQMDKHVKRYRYNYKYLALKYFCLLCLF